MWPCLLLALALLGTVPTSHSDASRGAEVRAGTGGCQAVPVPQAYCRDVYRGQLASVHSAARNQELQKLARTYTRHAVWIRAVTSRRTGKWESCWEDSSPWNYANWAPTYPHRIVTTCTTLSTRDGLWRSRPCFQLRPFICQY
ncbi:PRG2 protein, partial [Neopipo cinnamomea]|nr:PRG2 protein [Neopipo cinnamomea]